MYYRRVPPFGPGKGHKFLMCCSTLDFLCILEERLKTLLCRIWDGYRETIATHMAFRAGMIEQRRNSTSSKSYPACSNLVKQSITHKNVLQEGYFFCLSKNVYGVIGVQYTALCENSIT